MDNDGDGVNDSVWVDLDLPLITSAEGKLLKMMTAYYIEDLDNRLDLNAVGNSAQLTSNDFRANPIEWQSDDQSELHVASDRLATRFWPGAGGVLAKTSVW